MERFETGVPRLCARVEVVWGSVYGCVGTSRSEFLNGFRSWYVAALASQGVILCFKGWAVFSHLVILASVLGLLSVVVLGCRVFTRTRASVAGHIGFPGA
jgi:hypothetical protein